MKNLIYGIIAVIIIGIGWYYFAPGGATPTDQAQTVPQGSTTAPAGSVVVPAGTYTVDASQSTVNWAGAKPLIPGYTDSGTIGVKGGTITVSADSATADILIDMSTVTVTSTFKTNAEAKLQEHLKDGDFFNVTKYPTAEFKITKVTPRSDSATTFIYDITGTLTMKGKTNDVSFPATIYSQNGVVHANAETAIDRTKWDITFNSKNFFDNLADNVIDDMVQLHLTLVATAAK